jgi:hypothetical protein
MSRRIPLAPHAHTFRTAAASEPARCRAESGFTIVA